MSAIMSAFGTSRKFAATQQLNRLRSEADIQRAALCEKAGVAAVYTPKDFELNRIMADVVRIVERANRASNV